MRQIYKRKKRLTWYGSLQTVSIILMHYFFIIAYILFWELFRHLFDNKAFFILNINSNNWILFYFYTLAPLLNGIFHLLYRDTGVVIWRMLIWFFSLCAIFAIPLVILI